MPSTHFRRDAKSSGALLDLHRRVGVGQDFSDACATTALCFHIDSAELRQAYEDACRELAVACRALQQPTNREPLEGMLLLDLPDERQVRASVLRFDGIERRRA